MPKRRESATVRGYDAQWRDLQRKHIRRYPECTRCGNKGEIVDHITPIRKAPQLRLDAGNLMTLCRVCHGIKTARKDYGKKGGLMPDTNADGMPLDPSHPWNENAD